MEPRSLVVLAVLLSGVSANALLQCSPGFVPRNNSCTCVSDVVKQLKGYVWCAGNYSKLLECYCIDYNVSGLHETVIGPCVYGCFMDEGRYYTLNRTYDELNQEMCGRFRRNGLFCSHCENGYSLPAYSYDPTCVNCTDSSNNIIKYIAIVYGPLTVFLFTVVLFRISVTTPFMEIFVVLSQCVSEPIMLREEAILFHGSHSSTSYAFKIIISVFSIWNLDFFRTVYDPFCIKPNVSEVVILSLDYAIAAYPLAMITLMYLLLELHNRGYRVVVCIWKPFHLCLVFFRKRWDVQNSLVDAFATFILLSYTKFVTVSADIIIPAFFRNVTAHNSFIAYKHWYMFNDPELQLFNGIHLKFSILAVCVLLLIGFVPMYFLVAYPCYKHYVNSRRFTLRYNLLYSLIEAFQGHYKDGTNGTRDFRYFSFLYFILRCLLMLSYSFTLGANFYPIATFLIMVSALLIITVRPYKRECYNILHAFLLSAIALWFLSLYFFNNAVVDIEYVSAFVAIFFLAAIFCVYFGFLILRVVFLCKKAFFCALYIRLKGCLLRQWQSVLRNRNEVSFENSSEHSSLLTIQ